MPCAGRQGTVRNSGRTLVKKTIDAAALPFSSTLSIASYPDLVFAIPRALDRIRHPGWVLTGMSAFRCTYSKVSRAIDFPTELIYTSKT